MSKHQVFALIVGINKYKSKCIPNLAGCVSDAMLVKDYLVNNLGVPSSHAILLTDEAASRNNIIQTFRDHFTLNDKVLVNDSIVFYFAGHGSLADVPEAWKTDSWSIDVLCPYDEAIDAEDGPPVFGITARTFWGLFHELTSVKHNNSITTILDCSHVYGNRPGRTARCHPHRVAIPADLDSNLLTNGTNSPIPSKFRHTSVSNHILLTACREDEVAYELETDDGLFSGAFTHALLQTLHQLLAHRTTYASLLELLPPIVGQHPQCEGANQRSILYTTKALTIETQFYTVRKSPSGTISVNAGSIHGVVPGTEFTLYKRRTTALPPLATLHASSIESNSSVLVPWVFAAASDVPNSAYALISRWENPESMLLVFLNGQSLFTSLRGIFGHGVASEDLPGVDIYRASSSADADLILRDTDEGLDIERVDHLIAHYAHPRPVVKPYNNVDHIRHFLLSAALFKFHLLRSNNCRPLHNLVTVELYQLKRAEGGDGEHVAIGNNLLASGHAEIVVNDEPYGITISNDSDYDLFPYLFYFDPSDLSIQQWYLPPSRTMSPPLRQRSKLTIGHGNYDVHVFKFTLRPDEMSDTGFLKLFLSTRYTDMTYIEQESASKPSGAKVWNGHTGLQDDIWDTSLSVITVKLRDDHIPTGSTKSRLPSPLIIGSLLVAVFCLVFVAFKLLTISVL